MKKGEWTFITHHGRILSYLAKHPWALEQKMAFDLGLSLGAVCKIIINLKEEGYISCEKEGRRNHYTVCLDRPMRHPFDRDHKVCGLLAALGCNGQGNREESVTQNG